MEENKIIRKVDYNCDLAQSYGKYRSESELEIIDSMSSVNISCGFHAADPLTIKKVLEYCVGKNKVIGAHIGFPDIQGFGYKNFELDDEEIEAIVIYQVGALAVFAKSYGLEIEHVRPHGAMYRLASENLSFALSIGRAIKKISSWLVYYGASGAVTEQIGAELNLNIAQEVLLDKVYTESGSIDYSANNLTDSSKSIERLKKLLESSEIDNVNGGFTKVCFDTIHFNSSANNSIELAKAVKEISQPLPINYNRAVPSGWV